MSELLAYVNGGIVPLETAAVGVLDRGFLYGDGLFETIRVSGGRPVRLSAHLDRLRAGAGVIGLLDAVSRLDLESAIRSLLDASSLANARLRLTVTGGRCDLPGALAARPAEPTVVITAHPLATSDPKPARVTISTIRRDESNPLCRVKSLNYLPAVMARIEAESVGADEAILLNSRGSVTEGTVSNLFLVRGRRLVTPSLDQGPLPGTVRAAVIAIAPQLGLEVSERAVEVSELSQADEMFLTNAIHLARPIREFNGKPIGAAGFPITAQVLQALRALD